MGVRLEFLQVGNPNQNTCDQIVIETTGNATDFGDLPVAVYGNAQGNASSFTRALSAGGYNGSSYVNTINYIHFNSLGNFADFGDLTVARNALGQHSSKILELFLVVVKSLF